MRSSGCKCLIRLTFDPLKSILFTMAKRTVPVFPQGKGQLEQLGERLRLARHRRRLTQAVVAARVGVSKQTLAKLEAGNASTSLATLVRLLGVLGLAQDIDCIATDDELGRRLQDIELKAPPRGKARR
jgi:DNA-binding XRE family transcriptional regulator